MEIYATSERIELAKEILSVEEMETWKDTCTRHEDFNPMFFAGYGKNQIVSEKWSKIK
jgi:hypothetical protein